MGNPPTVAERSTEPPTRATGGAGGGAEENFLRFNPERFGDITGNSFRVRLRSPADPHLRSLPGGDGSPEQAARHKKEMSSTPQKQEPQPRVA
jgi:hypothetical protein